MTQAKGPNFLFITTDQQRADHLGCYGNAVIKTPAIDGLTGRGLTFDRYYAAWSPSINGSTGHVATARSVRRRARAIVLADGTPGEPSPKRSGGAG